jgi:transcriptional regulator with XRE-family HTH domain
MSTQKERINTHLPIGSIIKQLREAERYTKTQFAKMVGVSKNHIGEIESGSCFPSYSKLVKILFILGYEPTIRRIPKFPQIAAKKIRVKKVKEEVLNAEAPAPIVGEVPTITEAPIPTEEVKTEESGSAAELK